MSDPFEINTPTVSLSSGLYRDDGSCLPTVGCESTYLLEGQAEQDRFISEMESLIERWLNETLHISSTLEMVSHPAYLQIISKGERALPFIFRELEKAPGHWFTALRAITGADPVPGDVRGDMKTMRDHWIRWAEAEGYA